MTYTTKQDSWEDRCLIVLYSKSDCPSTEHLEVLDLLPGLLWLFIAFCLLILSTIYSGIG